MLRLQTAWTARLAAAPAAWPTVAGTAAYVALRNESVVAVSLASGSTLWVHPSGTLYPPVTDGERVYVARREAVEAVEVATGQPAWATPLDSPPSTTPYVVAGWVFVAMQSGDVVALRAAGGDRVWARSLGAAARAIAVSGARVFVGLNDGRVVALAIETGEPAWEARADGPIAGLHVAADRVYAGSDDNFFYCFTADRGRLDWRVRTGADVIGNAVSDDKRVYFVSLDTLLRALDRRTGVQRWKRALPARPLSGPVVVGPLIVVPGLMSEVRAYRTSTGELAGRAPLGVDLAAPPLVVESTIPQLNRFLVLTEDGRLSLLEEHVEPPLVPLTKLPGVTVPLTEPPSPLRAPVRVPR